MTLSQALAVAAAALVVAIGPTSGSLVSTASAQVSQALDRASIRSAVAELADLMEANYVFPDAARQYAEHLRTRAAAGAYDGLTEPAQLARTLQTELRGVHADAHLRVTVNDSAASADGAHVRRGPPSGGPAISDVSWLADGVGYFRINGLPSTDESVAQMTQALDQLADAQTLIMDLRRCPGGALREMDVLFSRLYAEPTRVMIMDTRADAAMPDPQEISPNLRRVSGPAGVARDEHWAAPTTPVSSLSDARVYVLTGNTGSACEHLSQALRETGRATLVGTPTGGAGHYGGNRSFGGGRFEIFLPVGNSYAPGAQSWEGVGVLPHRNVPADDALNDVLRELGVAQTAATPPPSHAGAVQEIVRVDNAASPTRRYGLGMAIEPGADTIEIQEVADGFAAARSGVRAGDRILSINGRPVREITDAEFGPLLRSSPLTIVVDRGGAQMTFNMSLD